MDEGAVSGDDVDSMIRNIGAWDVVMMWIVDVVERKEGEVVVVKTVMVVIVAEVIGKGSGWVVEVTVVAQQQ